MKWDSLNFINRTELGRLSKFLPSFYPSLVDRFSYVKMSVPEKVRWGIFVCIPVTSAFHWSVPVSVQARADCGATIDFGRGFGVHE